MLNESDTRVKLIDPKLHESNWNEDSIVRERFITSGKILDEDGNRRAGKKPDYILNAFPSFPIAIVEAKDERHDAMFGMQQAKNYAKEMDVYFAYSTNGHEIEEFDFFTNKQTSIKTFPSPKDLINRYFEKKIKNLTFTKDDKPFAVSVPFDRNKTPRYYQEITIKKSIEAFIKNKKRILITLATGTGKTNVAFWTIWKLFQSGSIRRVLYISDRIVLRDQAYNCFSPFGDARTIIGDGKIPKVRDIYFSTYQSLYSEIDSRTRLFQMYDPDFFDIIIVDECHRSGFGTWNDILKYFKKAVHFGMTATPKRDDNIDTYKYFGNPIYSYSLGKGIDDGFLAPYKIHKVFTNIDKQGGISLKDIESEGVEVYIPEESKIKDFYSSGEFEKQILLPDRTIKIARHLAKVLKVFEPMQKTMVFCVTNDHANLVAKELQNYFAGLGYDDYAVRIVSEEPDAKEILEKFVDSDKITPVVATTVDLLTTGVDAPSVHNIVLLRPISSKVLFKQIIGRGSRVDASSNKYYFRIIDYLNTTRLLDPWDYPDEEETDNQLKGPFDYYIIGRVVDKKTGDPINNVAVKVLLGPNRTIHKRTDKTGFFSFSDLPRGNVKVTIASNHYIKKEFKAKTSEAPETSILIELKKKVPAKEKIRVKGLTVYIAEETYVEIEGGKTLNKAKYVEYSKEELQKRIISLGDLQRVWLDPNLRTEFLQKLKKYSIHPEVIGSLLERPDADTFDVLAHITFDAPIITRDERAKSLLLLKSNFLNSFGPEAKEVLQILLEKYRIAGINEFTPKVFELPPFDKKGYILGVAKIFGGLDKLKNAILEVQKGIYSDFGKNARTQNG